MSLAARTNVTSDPRQDIHIAIRDQSAAGDEPLERGWSRLRRSIRRLPVAEVEPVWDQASISGNSPSIDGLSVGDLLVKLRPQVVPLLCAVLQEWLAGSGRRLRISCGNTMIDASGNLTPEQTSAILKATGQRRADPL